MEQFLNKIIEGNKFELTIDTNIFSKDINCGIQTPSATFVKY